MAKPKVSLRPDDKLAAIRLDVFGPAPLIEGENQSGYDQLLALISAAVSPKDIFEEIWVREIVDLSWEVLRWRRLKVALMAGSASEGIRAALGPLYGIFSEPFALETKTHGYITRDPVIRKEVEETLASAGFSHETVQALTLAAKLPQVEQIDRLISSAESRRNATLREIERHRRDTADRIRMVTKLIDGEFDDASSERLISQAAE